MEKTVVLALIILVRLSPWGGTTPSKHFSYFRKSGFCLNTTCMKEAVQTVRGTTECALKCTKMNTCSGFEYNKTKSSCSLLNEDCFSDLPCEYYDDPNRRVYELTNNHTCLNNGNYDISTATCKCLDGWVGKACERRPYNCKELNDYGYAYGFHRVVVDVARDQSLLPVVSCRIREKSTSAFIQRNSGRTRHDKSWQNFVSGYTIDNTNFWLGLENIWTLNRMGHTEIQFRVAMRGNGNEWNIRYLYSNFQISDATSGYSFVVDPGVLKWSGPESEDNGYTVEDVLSLCAGRSFLTPDKDNSQNCAQQAETGWWFPDCRDGISVNPLGYVGNSTIRLPGPMNIHLPGLNMTDENVQNMFFSADMYFRTVHRLPTRSLM